MIKSSLNDVLLKEVTKSDIEFLYFILKERDPKANISHKKMPTFGEHVKFVMSKPYKKWYIIYQKNNKIGSAYITNQNEIGIFIKKQRQRSNVGSKALDLLVELNPQSRYLANISPRNTQSINFFKKKGFKLIQYTYELIKTN